MHGSVQSTASSVRSVHFDVISAWCSTAAMAALTRPAALRPAAMASTSAAPARSLDATCEGMMPWEGPRSIDSALCETRNGSHACVRLQVVWDLQTLSKPAWAPCCCPAVAWATRPWAACHCRRRRGSPAGGCCVPRSAHGWAALSRRRAPCTAPGPVSAMFASATFFLFFFFFFYNLAPWGHPSALVSLIRPCLHGVVMHRVFSLSVGFTFRACSAAFCARYAAWICFCRFSACGVSDCQPPST